jgi:hypothetical protein
MKFAGYERRPLRVNAAFSPIDRAWLIARPAAQRAAVIAGV